MDGNISVIRCRHPHLYPGIIRDRDVTVLAMRRRPADASQLSIIILQSHVIDPAGRASFFCKVIGDVFSLFPYDELRFKWYSEV